MTKSLNGPERYFAAVGYLSLILLWWVTSQLVLQSYYNVVSSGASYLYVAMTGTFFGIAAVGSIFYINEGAKTNVALGIAKAVILSLLAGALSYAVLSFSATVMT